MEEEKYEDAVRYAARPETLMSLRSCIKCRLVKTLDQFQDAFCDNCWSFWDGNESGELPSTYKKGRALDMALQNTTADFEGLTSVMRPNDSWVAKWLKLNKVGENGERISLLPGVYAITLPGRKTGGERYVNDYAEEAKEEEGEEEGATHGEGEKEGGEEEEDEDGAGGGAGSDSSSSSSEESSGSDSDSDSDSDEDGGKEEEEEGGDTIQE